ncbi:MAG: PAS domain-containing protein [Lysobacter sp.]|nr:PAS domain-containing protein [Lysobacter sp.]
MSTPRSTGAAIEPRLGLFRSMLDVLPLAAYVCAPDGLITYFNPKVVEVWGRTPALNDAADRYCGSYGVFSVGGAPIPPGDSLMAEAMRHRREYHGCEIQVERPDGSRIPMLAYATPLLDENGEVVAGISLLVDLNERDRWDRLLRSVNSNHEVALLAEGLRAELALTSHTLELLERTLAEPRGWRGLDVQLMQKGLQEMRSLLEDLLARSRRSPEPGSSTGVGKSAPN